MSTLKTFRMQIFDDKKQLFWNIPIEYSDSTFESKNAIIIDMRKVDNCVANFVKMKTNSIKQTVSNYKKNPKQ